MFPAPIKFSLSLISFIEVQNAKFVSHDRIIAVNTLAKISEVMTEAFNTQQKFIFGITTPGVPMQCYNC